MKNKNTSYQLEHMSVLLSSFEESINKRNNLKRSVSIDDINSRNILRVHCIRFNSSLVDLKFYLRYENILGNYINSQIKKIELSTKLIESCTKQECSSELSTAIISQEIKNTRTSLLQIKEYLIK